MKRRQQMTAPWYQGKSTFFTAAAILSLGTASMVGCSAAPPPPPPPPAPAPPPPPPPEPEPEVEVEAPPEEPVVDSGEPAPSGRPPVVMTGTTKVSGTFGQTPAAKLELGGLTGATLRIPEYALSNSINITFAQDPKGKKTKGATGQVYSLEPQIAPSPDPTTVESSGKPFELKLPNASAGVNLAIGVVDEAANKVTWRIIAAKNVDEDAKFAFFELTKLEPSFVHLTTEAPTN